MTDYQAIVVGAGPAGLMAAEVLSQGGLGVTVFDRMPSPGRKFLMAGRGGLNLTHSEPFDAFLSRYGDGAAHLDSALRGFTPTQLRAWAEGLGQPTFVGTSGRVFPTAMKASPLLRAWISRLTSSGVQFRYQETWTGWDDQGCPVFRDAAGASRTIEAEAQILALGGASWPRLGSDGTWLETLATAGLDVQPFEPANGGFLVEWSDRFKGQFAGHPLKAVRLTFEGRSVVGEAMITQAGLQGGGVYALSRSLREGIGREGVVTLDVDLRPALTEAQLVTRLAKGRAGDSLSNRLRKTLNLSPLEIALLREAHGAALPQSPEQLAKAIKASPLQLTGLQPIDRAISSAGGVRFASLDQDYMAGAKPGLFLAGEMLDWEAPTGGYLLQACFATGKAAGEAALAYIKTGRGRGGAPLVG